LPWLANSLLLSIIIHPSMANLRRPRCIIGVGKNYPDLINELEGEHPQYPEMFFKNPASVIGNGEPIVISPIASTPEMGLDYEGELAVVLGRDVRDVVESEALSAISHLAVANDVSQRWWQNYSGGGQWCRAKSFDTFCPLSELVPITAVHDIQNLQLETRLNGELVQQANTSSMIFTVASLIAQLSAGTTLLEGTVILTGTPGGLGMNRTPMRFMRPGDVVEVSIEGVGQLRNPVVEQN